MKALTRYRQGLAEQIAHTKTKVICLMDSYFPEYASPFSDMFGAASAALMSKSPIPAEIARMKTPALVKLLSSASRGRRGQEKAEEVRQAAKDPSASIWASRRRPSRQGSILPSSAISARSLRVPIGRSRPCWR